MNKRIYHFLLPLLVILFSIICRGDNAVFFQESTPGLSITEISDAHTLPFSTDLKKGDKKVNINAIRVKARHDILAVNIPAHGEPVVHFVYYTKAYYSSYNFCELYANLPGYNLRGPPSA